MAWPCCQYLNWLLAVFPASSGPIHPSQPYFLPPSLNITLFCPTWNWRCFLPDSSTLWTVKLSCQHPPSHPTINSPPIFISTPILLHFLNVAPLLPPLPPAQRIEKQINLYLKFNKQFDFEDDMQRTKANFAGCVFGNFQTLAEEKETQCAVQQQPKQLSNRTLLLLFF